MSAVRIAELRAASQVPRRCRGLESILSVSHVALINGELVWCGCVAPQRADSVSGVRNKTPAKRLQKALKKRKNGAPDKVRTRDPLITNQVLYQLSYKGSGCQVADFVAL